MEKFVKAFAHTPQLRSATTENQGNRKNAKEIARFADSTTAEPTLTKPMLPRGQDGTRRLDDCEENSR